MGDVHGLIEAMSNFQLLGGLHGISPGKDEETEDFDGTSGPFLSPPLMFWKTIPFYGDLDIRLIRPSENSAWDVITHDFGTICGPFF